MIASAPLIGSIPRMSEGERRTISEFIEREFGIRMPAAKKTLLKGRLAKRLAACGLSSYGAYFEYVTQDPRGRDEFLIFSDLVSTHETSFFREAEHFRFLTQAVLPSLAEQKPPRNFDFLSAACSTGEEAYTIAMVAEQFLRDSHRSTSFLVEGLDLSERAVSVAQRGVYTAERVAPVPPVLTQAFLMKSRDASKNFRRIVPELRVKTRFHTGNLLGDLGLANRRFDAIFCRNVLIYFDKETQWKVVRGLLNHLRPGGWLFLGHSESLLNSGLPLKPVFHAVYQKVE